MSLVKKEIQVYREINQIKIVDQQEDSSSDSDGDAYGGGGDNNFENIYLSDRIAVNEDRIAVNENRIAVNEDRIAVNEKRTLINQSKLGEGILLQDTLQSVEIK